MSNTFTAKGNLGANPVLKRLTGKNGQFEVATMRVMFARYGQNQDSGEIEQVGGFWREVEIYGEKAAACARLLRKGARVLVVGEEVEFTAHDGNNNEVQAFKIVASDIALQLTRVKSVEYEEARRQGEEVPA